MSLWSGYALPACHPEYGNPRQQPAECPLIKRGNLSRRSRPALTSLTVTKYLREWLVQAKHLGPKTSERYGQLIEQQIIPHLGATLLHRLHPKQLAEWHAALLEKGGARGRPLSPRTCGHAHRVLRTALARAVELEVLSKNVAAVLHPPPVEASEVVILTEAETAELLPRLVADPRGEGLYPVAALALASGLRRGNSAPWPGRISTPTIALSRSSARSKRQPGGNCGSKNQRPNTGADK